MHLLNVEDLQFSISGNVIVNHFSIVLKEGETVAILGESGSGKSTVLRLIAGLEQPESGHLALDGKRILPPSEKLIPGHESIKLVRQDYGLFPNVSLRENVAYEVRFFDKAYQRERVDKLLALSRLTELSHRLPREVSGGEQQRTVIARALADEPRLLLLDEPFSHLDRLNKERLKSEILAMIAEERSGCIFVTHDVSDAYGIAERIVVINEGRAVQVGTPQEIYYQPINKFVAELTGNVTILSVQEYGQISAVNHGTSGDVLVRPEWLRKSAMGFAAKIVEKTFYGQHYLYTVTYNDVRLRWASAEEFDTGQTINLAVHRSWHL